MGLAVRPILIHLCLLSSPSLFLLLFFLLCSILTFAGNLPSSPYFPADSDIQFQNCHCFESSDGVAGVVPHTPIPNSSRPKILKILLYFGQGNAIATAFIMVITLLNVVAFKLRELQEAKSEETSEPALSLSSEYSCRKFSLAEMKLATQNFDEGLVIGKGGFGKVYKGLINHGASVVAIKRLDLKSKQGASEFWTEIKMLSKLRHSHLVSLFGYCNDFDEMILVYEHVACGSLADRLLKIGKSNGPSSLSWVQRLKICLGAARALDYLHTSTGAQHRVIHRDVKSSNILLDENWCAKISDFGVSKVGPLNQPWTYVSTDVKGSFGYFDPEYFLTRRLTRKSDVYSFGVVLFEVLFGRPAVDLSREEEQRGLAGWGLHCIKEGIVEENIDPNLRGQILPNCLMLYVQIAGQCLQNLPRKRPTVSEVVFKLESAMALQEITDYSLAEGRVEAGDNYDNQAKEKVSMAEGSVACNGESKTGANDGTTQSRLGDASSKKSLTKSAVSIPFSRKLRQLFSAKAHVDSESSVAGSGESKTGAIDGTTQSRLDDASSKKSLRKSAASIPFSRKLRQFFTAKAHVASGILTNTSNGGGFSTTTNNSAGQSRLSISASDETCVGGEILPAPNLKIYTFADLRSATKNFNSDVVLGVGGFGTVFKGWVDDKTLMPVKYGTGLIVAIKKLNAGSMQGFDEWQSEVNFLGRLSHPNLVKLIGYCWEDKDLLLVYEFMQKGSLEHHIFRRNTAVEPLSWSIRLKIAMGAARGLVFLHSSDEHVIIYRDFKASNILLDENYNAKLSDFGLAKMGPSWGMSHVSTRVMGTYGYAAPEYVATGHLYVKSDVYGFGVVLLEMLSGLQALDMKRPSAQHNLIDWAKPFLIHKRKIKTILDARMEGQYSLKAAYQVAQLILQCLEIEPKNRPSMKEVVEVLEHIDSMTKEPKSVSSHSSSQFGAAPI